MIGKRHVPGFLVALCVLLFTTSAFAEFQVPPVPASNPVYDGPDVLTPAQEKAIGEKLVAFKKQHGIEVGVAIIPTLGDMSIKEAGYEIATAWGLGDKERKDGLLLLVVADKANVAPPGSKGCGCVRFEVGEYLEGDLTDITSKEILVQEMVHLVSAGKYHEGITGALKGVKVVLGSDSEAAKQYKATSDSGGEEKEGWFPWWGWLIAFAIACVLQWMGVPVFQILFIFVGRGGGGSSGGGGGNSVGGGGSFGGGGGDA